MNDDKNTFLFSLAALAVLYCLFVNFAHSKTQGTVCV